MCVSVFSTSNDVLKASPQSSHNVQMLPPIEETEIKNMLCSHQINLIPSRFFKTM